MDLQSLRTFHLVAQLKNFSRAAEAMGITQPAASLQVKRLESQLGVRLFERIGNNIKLTPEGQLAYDYSERIGGLVETMVSDVRFNSTSPSGDITVGATWTPGVYFLPRIIPSLNAIYPKLRITLQVTTYEALKRHIEANEVDIAMIAGQTVDNPLFVSELIGDDLLVPVFSARKTLRTVDEFVALLETELVLREPNSILRNMAQMILANNGLAIAPHMEVTATESIKRLLALRGISFLPYSNVAEEVKAGQLATAAFAGFAFKFPIRIIYHRNKFFSKALSVFKDFVATNIELPLSEG